MKAEFNNISSNKVVSYLIMVVIAAIGVRIVLYFAMECLGYLFVDGATNYL